MSDVTTADLYEVTMALSYLREDMRAPATFSLFVRDLPPGRGFLVAAGLEPVLDFLAEYRVEREDVEEFADALHRPVRDLEPLLGLSFEGEVRAVPEGHAVFAYEPLLEVTAPLPQAQLVETYLLNQVCHQTVVASKAARCVLAAAGHPMVDFSLRRTHGPQAGFQAARLGALAGFAGTSNIAAATALGFPASGTMAHSYIETFPGEEEAFRAFARCHLRPVTFLVDSYDTEAGVRVAAHVLSDLRRGPGCAIRLDSGDLDALARRSRAILVSSRNRSRASCQLCGGPVRRPPRITVCSRRRADSGGSSPARAMTSGCPARRWICLRPRAVTFAEDNFITGRPSYSTSLYAESR